jgi:hypothetical protein
MTDELLPEDHRDVFDHERFQRQGDPVDEQVSAVRDHVVAELRQAFPLHDEDFVVRLVIPGDPESTDGTFVVVRWRARLHDVQGEEQSVTVPRTEKTVLLDGVTTVWDGTGDERTFLDVADWSHVQAQLGSSPGRPVLA